jgi:hypothetical protein
MADTARRRDRLGHAGVQFLVNLQAGELGGRHGHGATLEE